MTDTETITELREQLKLATSQRLRAQAEVKELVEALEMALQIGDGCSRGALGAFQQKANAILTKIKG